MTGALAVQSIRRFRLFTVGVGIRVGPRGRTLDSLTVFVSEKMLLHISLKREIKVSTDN